MHAACRSWTARGGREDLFRRSAHRMVQGHRGGGVCIIHCPRPGCRGGRGGGAFDGCVTAPAALVAGPRRLAGACWAPGPWRPAEPRGHADLPSSTSRGPSGATPDRTGGGRRMDTVRRSRGGPGRCRCITYPLPRPCLPRSDELCAWCGRSTLRCPARSDELAAHTHIHRSGQSGPAGGHRGTAAHRRRLGCDRSLGPAAPVGHPGHLNPRHRSAPQPFDRTTRTSVTCRVGQWWASAAWDGAAGEGDRWWGSARCRRCR